MESQRYIPCTVCGKVQDIIFYRKTNEYSRIWNEKHICFDCAFWEHFFSKGHENTYVINGNVYIVNPIKSDLKRVKKPSKKSKEILHFVTPDLKTLIRCWDNEMYHQGALPAHQHSLHPDNLYLTTKEYWWRLFEYKGVSCPRKGCYDRYHCVFYHPEISEPDGPWNKIPKDYHIGDEECESFVDKTNLFKEIE